MTTTCFLYIKTNMYSNKNLLVVNNDAIPNISKSVPNLKVQLRVNLILHIQIIPPVLF